MPVFTFSAGATLTAAQLNSIAGMLPYAATAAGNVNPCVAGTLYRCTSSSAQTMTLPAAALGAVIGFVVDTATPVSVTVTAGGNKIFSPSQPNRTTATMVLTLPDSYLVLQGDGTNWHEIASAGGAVPVFGVGTAVVGVPVAGAQPFLLQAGTNVITTNAGGGFNITYPVAFPHGVLTAQMTVGDGSVPKAIVQCSQAFMSLTVINAIALDASTGVGLNTATIRVNWLSLGF